jgi:hypothetical protein
MRDTYRIVTTAELRDAAETDLIEIGAHPVTQGGQLEQHAANCHQIAGDSPCLCAQTAIVTG